MVSGSNKSVPGKGQPVSITAFGRENVPGMLTGNISESGQWEIAFNQDEIKKQFEKDHDFQRDVRRIPLVYLESDLAASCIISEGHAGTGNESQDDTDDTRVKEITIHFETPMSYQNTLCLKIPDDDIGLADLVPEIQQLSDIIIRSELQRKIVTCRPLCGACCRQLVPISLPEAFYLSDIVNRLPLEKQKNIRQRFLYAIRVAEEKRLLFGPDPETIWFGLGIPCPFLEDNQCIIYERRPLACREYYVDSHREFCSEPFDRPVQKLKIRRTMAAIMTACASGLYGVPKSPIPLFLALHFAERHGYFLQEKWPGLQIFDRIISCLTGLNDENLRLSVPFRFY